ncbi:hypothetical protein MMC32_001412 [Xylographa parallela]|nr:hypothetical protein [Xylographa parallela]
MPGPHHIWTSVQTNHAICLEIHGVLGPRQIAAKLNAAFGCNKDFRTVRNRLNSLAGRLCPSEAARREGGNFVHDEWRYWQSRGMHHQDVQEILRVHGLFEEEEEEEEGDEEEEEEMTEAEDKEDEDEDEDMTEVDEDMTEVDDAGSELDSAVTA